MGKEESKMLSHENRINTKSELKDWIEYERKKYGGGYDRRTERSLSHIRK